MNPSIPQNLDEYSASATTIKFDRPIPLLRGPIPAGPPDDPSISPHVLAFRNPQSWAVAYKTCESKIISQCEEGARFGCAITASNKCKPPWWRGFIGGARLEDLKERERCEDREMEGCLVEAKDKCVGFAKEKCWKPFRDARIAVREEEVVRNLVSLVSVPQRSKEEGAGGLEFWELHGSCCLTVASFLSGRFCGLDWALKRIRRPSKIGVAQYHFMNHVRKPFASTPDVKVTRSVFP
ncbi:hypothetical protein POTOM_009550 [Populus tomentosa]|uniref:Uncharacterized protein n=1 Tax=Populus tomentosa TaxID=118781 RepID=A0A8X8AC64_POPTO|nr:hypothetical protein POTOM_009550 [Populus tomentosa]